MQRREKILATFVGVLAVGWGGNWMFEQTLRGPLEERERRIERLRDEIEGKERQLADGRKAGQRLDRWQQQSLPTDLEIARSDYRNWLLHLVDQSGFKNPHVDSGEAVSRRDVYRRLPFSVRGRATLEQLTQFLYAFYEADHLQQIDRLSINPVAGTDLLDLTMSIEALILPGTDRSDRLNDGRSVRLASASLTDYSAIAQRNLFGQRGAGPLDDADHTHLTAILDVDGRPQAWFTIRTNGRVLKLQAGDRLEIANVICHVEDIDSQDVILSTDDERWLLTLGESLRDATALPPEF